MAARSETRFSFMSLDMVVVAGGRVVVTVSVSVTEEVMIEL